MMQATPYALVSFGTYLLLVIGILNRKKRNFHALFMGSAIFLDLAMVLLLEVKRGAVEEVINGGLNDWLLCHVIVSSMAVLLYIPVVVLGVMRLRKYGEISHRVWHIRLGISAFFFRTLGLIFLMVYLSC